jgi:hypothetical protein
MTTFDNEKVANSSNKFYCKSCNYGTCRKSNIDKHYATAKHMKTTFFATFNNELDKKVVVKKYSCEQCDKEFNDRAGLWRHKKKCSKTDIIYEDAAIKENKKTDFNMLTELFKLQINENMEMKELMKEQYKENQKLQQQLLEIAKEGKTTNTNCNNNNNNTNTFNLQFFLNEQCKDALNIMDFINQIQLKLSDLDMVGKVGYSEGISKIFIRGLKELDVFKRPIHCSDLKREVLYVKDKDAWEKDNDEKNKIKTAIKYIAAKNFKQIHEWQDENPESDDYDSKKHMEYHNIVINSMGGSTDKEDDQNYNKIIKNVAKEVVIDKK